MRDFKYMVTSVNSVKTDSIKQLATSEKSLEKWVVNWVNLGYTVTVRKLTEYEKEKFNKVVDKEN